MIKDYRQAAGLTQKQFSELFTPQIPIDTIKKWDSGKMKPTDWVEGLIIEKLEKMKGEKEMTLYKVVKAIFGADRTVNLYFKTKKEADEFYNSSDYVDEPVKVTLTEEQAFNALAATEYYFEK